MASEETLDGSISLIRNTAAVKIAGSIMTMEIENGKDQNLTTTAAILNTVALSPLLNASLSFLNVGLNKSRSFTRHIAAALKPLHLLIIVGLFLSVSGGVSRTKTSQNSLDDGARELQAASGVFALAWVLMAFACLIYMANIYHVQRSAKRLILSVTLAMPMLFVRVVYSGLNAINLDTSSSTGHTAKFNPVTGDWGIYLALGLVPEFGVVILYTICGIINSLSKDKDTASEYEGIESP